MLNLSHTKTKNTLKNFKLYNFACKKIVKIVFLNIYKRRMRKETEAPLNFFSFHYLLLIIILQILFFKHSTYKLFVIKKKDTQRSLIFILVLTATLLGSNRAAKNF